MANLPPRIRQEISARTKIPFSASANLRCQIHHLDLVRRADDRIRHALPGRGAGDPRHHVGRLARDEGIDGGLASAKEAAIQYRTDES
jgi:hypothetical protein